MAAGEAAATAGDGAGAGVVAAGAGEVAGAGAGVWANAAGGSVSPATAVRAVKILNKFVFIISFLVIALRFGVMDGAAFYVHRHD